MYIPLYRLRVTISQVTVALPVVISSLFNCSDFGSLGEDIWIMFNLAKCTLGRVNLEAMLVNSSPILMSPGQPWSFIRGSL